MASFYITTVLLGSIINVLIVKGLSILIKKAFKKIKIYKEG